MFPTTTFRCSVQLSSGSLAPDGALGRRPSGGDRLTNSFLQNPAALTFASHRAAANSVCVPDTDQTNQAMQLHAHCTTRQTAHVAMKSVLSSEALDRYRGGTAHAHLPREQRRRLDLANAVVVVHAAAVYGDVGDVPSIAAAHSGIRSLREQEGEVESNYHWNEQ